MGLLPPLAALAGLAAWLYARRPRIETDTPAFAAALVHWAPVVIRMVPSPRELKRFLNRLRFTAAGGNADLPGDVLVGLGVIAHADIAMVRAFAEDGPPLMRAVRQRVQSLEQLVTARHAQEREATAETQRREVELDIMTAIRDTAGIEALAGVSLASFAPTPEQARAFLALWDGVTMRG